jgi:hypothetical protein
MRRPKSTRGLAIEQEDFIANKYGGRRSPSSGANSFDRGDVSYEVFTATEHSDGFMTKFLAECKVTEAQSFYLKRAVWEKIAQEALEQGRQPSMFIRFRSDDGKHLDLVVREVNDDLEILNR